LVKYPLQARWCLKRRIAISATLTWCSGLPVLSSTEIYWTRKLATE